MSATKPIVIEASRAPVTPSSPSALWSLGFRPFYLLASLFAAVSIPLWVAQYSGWLPFGYVADAREHASEMLYGYATAVIAGFLLTAGRNWTGQPTPAGRPLMGLAFLWLAGRVLAATHWPLAAALVNGAFPLAVAVGLAVPLARAGNRRNYFLVGLLALLGGLAATFGAARYGALAWPAAVDLRAGLDVVLFIMAVIGGRVIPMFTNNGVAGARARKLPLLERSALAGVVVLALADLLQAPASALALVCAVLAALHGARWLLWQPWRTLRTPLVWILHAAYGWIVIHFVLRVLAALQVVPDFLAIHALTIGGIGGLTLGMMTRTARGHTARPLKADRLDVACYGLIMAAALVRVAGPLIAMNAYLATVQVAAVCWTVAFLLYFVSYAPWLVRARADGKPG
jgi:uncharacterized protein involved in response to NO